MYSKNGGGGEQSYLSVSSDPNPKEVRKWFRSSFISGVGDTVLLLSFFLLQKFNLKCKFGEREREENGKEKLLAEASA